MNLQRRTESLTGCQTFSYPDPETPFHLVTWSAKRRALVAAVSGCPLFRLFLAGLKLNRRQYENEIMEINASDFTASAT